MIKQYKQVLDYMIEHEIDNTDEPFDINMHMLEPVSSYLKTEQFNLIRNIRALIESGYLRGFPEEDPVYISLTAKGRNYKRISLEEFMHFIMTSIVTPIIVSIITSLICHVLMP